MTASVSAWGELMKVAQDFVQTSVRTSEMLAASGTVIASRMGSIAGAVRNPWGGDHVELARIIPEKVTASSDAAMAIMNLWAAMAAQTSRHLDHVSSTFRGGRYVTVSELAALSTKTAALSTSVMALGLTAGGVALAPIHKKATANARRLAPPKR